MTNRGTNRTTVDRGRRQRRDLVAVRLPVGVADAGGENRRWAVMRPARAVDELKALSDFRVWLRPLSFPAVLLARVVLGFSRASAEGPPGEPDLVQRDLDEDVDVGRIESLDPADLRALEAAYRELNAYDRDFRDGDFRGGGIAEDAA